MRIIRHIDAQIRRACEARQSVAAIFASLICLAALTQDARAPARLNPHDEASRLIDALELSGAQRNVARDFVIFEMARGGTPRCSDGSRCKKRVGIQCKPLVCQPSVMMLCLPSQREDISTIGPGSR
jgi:DNA primase large subunit